MLILDPYDMAFDAVGVFGLDFWLLFKSALSYCAFDLVFNLQKCIDFSEVHPKTTCFAVKLYISPHENGFVNKA